MIYRPARGLRAASQHDRPTCFIAYTVKGFGLPLAGHKDNHAGLMTVAQIETLRDAMMSAKGTSGSRSRVCGRRQRELARSSPPCRSCAGLAPAGSRRRAGARQPGRRSAAAMSTQRLRHDARRDRQRRGPLADCDRHHLARCHRLDQSRRLGEPARAVRARDDGRHSSTRNASPRPRMGVCTAAASTSSSASPR